MTTKTEMVEWGGFAGIITRVYAPADAHPATVADLCRNEMVSRLGVGADIAAHDIGVGEMFVIPEGGE